MSKHLPFLLLLLGLIGCKPNTTHEDSTLEDRISRIENGLQSALQIKGDSVPKYNLEARLKDLNIPGLSIAVLKDGEIEWAKGYGMADSSENRPVTSETLFLAGSISKPVAATRAHQLAESGTISLDTNVNHYLHSWQLPENEYTRVEKVNTRRILNHTAGLTVWGFPGYDQGDTIPSLPEVLDGLGNTDSVRVYKEPGESWQYSGGGYTIMQLMMEDLDSRSFPDQMQEEVLNPLGMTKSTYENPLPDHYHGIAATGYRANGTEVEGKWPIYPEMAAAGLWTTPSQLLLWAKEIQSIQQNQKDGLLKVATVNEMLEAGLGGWGLGPSIEDDYYGHGGADEGFRANLKIWKDQSIAVVIMVNSDNGSIISEVLLSLAAEYDLAGLSPDIREVANLNPEQLSLYAGDYEFENGDLVKFQVQENGLLISADFLEQDIFILPESDSLFFDAEDGQPFNFSLEEGQVTGFSVASYTARRLIN